VSIQTKLTIRVERQWIERAKQYAAEHGTTVTHLVTDYLRRLPVSDEQMPATPILRRLTGILPSNVSTEEHYEYLAEKYDF
jgi:hypothetical protein